MSADKYPSYFCAKWRLLFVYLIHEYGTLKIVMKQLLSDTVTFPPIAITILSNVYHPFMICLY